MPRIKEIAPSINSQGPFVPRRVTEEDTGGIEARGLERVGEGLSLLGDVLHKRQEQAEVSDLGAKMSDAHLKFTTFLDDTLKTADPGDTTITEKFRQNFDDYMSKMSENVNTTGGKEYFNKASAQLRAHFVESAMAGQSELAGAKAKADAVSSLNNFSNALFKDPASYDTAKQLFDESVDTMVKSGRLPSKNALEFKSGGGSKLAEAAMRGWIRLNPEYASQQLNSGRWDSQFNEDVKHQLFGEIDMAVRGRSAEAERQKKQQEEVLKEQRMGTQNQFLEKLSKNQLTAKDILGSNLEPFGSGSKEQFIQLVESQSRKPAKSDPSVFRDLFERIHLPDGNPLKIVDENELNQRVIDGTLSFEDLNRLRGETQGRRTAAGNAEAFLKNNIMKSAYARMVKSDPFTGMKDPEGLMQYQAFSSFFLDEWTKERKAGKSVKALTDPKSPDYLGRYIDSYARSPEQMIRSMVRQAQPQSPLQPESTTTEPVVPNAAPAANADKMRRPGESIVDWRERTKGKN